MGESTTVRVRVSTRERLNSASAEQQASVDDVIVSALAALDRERWRRQAEADARRVAADRDDRREVAEVLDQLSGDGESAEA